MQSFSCFLDNESDTLALGERIAQACPLQQFTIYLEGELGAGKTTLVRGLLHQLGYDGKVKSPTYTLVESYDLKTKAVFHFDLYRLFNAEELDYLGLDDYFKDDALCLVEWAEKGQTWIPAPDVLIFLKYQSGGRHATISAQSMAGDLLISKIA